MRQSRIPNPPTLPQTNYGSTYRIEGDQKDVIIEKLKSEVDSLRLNEKQFTILKQQYADLDRKYRSQLQQKNLQDGDFKNRHQGALRHIGQLKNEADAIKAQLRDKKLEIQDLRADEETLKNSLDQRNIEIQKLRIDINALLCDSNELENERVSFTQQLQNLKANNALLSQDLFNLQKQNQACNHRLAQIQKYLEQLETQSHILKQKIKSYENTNNDLDLQIQTVINELSQFDTLLSSCQQNLIDLQAANASVSSNVDQFKSEALHHQKATQSEVMKSNELIKRLKQSDNILKVRLAQVEEGHNEINSLKAENENLERINSELSQDLQACRKHLQNLGLLNHQLINSLQNFSEEDKKAVELISRQQRVKYLGSRVQQTSSIQFYSGKETARTDVSFSSSRRRTRF